MTDNVTALNADIEETVKRGMSLEAEAFDNLFAQLRQKVLESRFQ